MKICLKNDIQIDKMKISIYSENLSSTCIKYKGGQLSKILMHALIGY